jgi:hypothetical protein
MVVWINAACGVQFAAGKNRKFRVYLSAVFNTCHRERSEAICFSLQKILIEKNRYFHAWADCFVAL